MLGVFVTGKVDRRSSFSFPLFSLSPLRKTSPTGGFFEFGSEYTLGNVGIFSRGL